MLKHFRRVPYLLAFLLLLALPTLPATPAHAASPLPIGKGLPKPNINAPVPLAQPNSGTTDQDIEIGATDGSTYMAVVAEGWLHLEASGSAVKGYFIDNFGGGKKYPASVNGSNGTVINTHIGAFVFDSKGNATTIPTKLGKNAKADISATRPHAYTVFNNKKFMFDPIFNYTPSVSGTIAFTIDNNGFVVPFSKAVGSVSAISVTNGSKTVLYPITAPSFTLSVIFQAKLNGKPTMFVQTDSTDGNISGIAVQAGDGAAGAFGEWELTT